MLGQLPGIDDCAVLRMLDPEEYLTGEVRIEASQSAPTHADKLIQMLGVWTKMFPVKSTVTVSFLKLHEWNRANVPAFLDLPRCMDLLSVPGLC